MSGEMNITIETQLLRHKVLAWASFSGPRIYYESLVLKKI